jgi:hypothetical protein
MHDFGRILRQRSPDGVALLFDQSEHSGEFGHCFFGRWHQGMASRNGGNFGNPAIGLVPIDHDLVVVELHDPIVFRQCGAANRG